ncbi:MAG: diadenylate cyclase CdaA [Bacillota bacterium]
MLNNLEFLRSMTAIQYILTVIDVGIVAFVIYKFIMLIKGTRAVQLIKGLVVLVVASFLSDKLGLTTVNWILDRTQLMILVALPVVFQPELRRALEQLGRGKFFARPITFLGPEDMSRLIREIVRATQVFVKNRHGALIVIERETGLNDYIETGIPVDGAVSAEFLVNIFTPKTPLHDGAVIVRGNRAAAAGCFLPLTDSPYLSKQLGTRHRAALGISEISDAVALIISEENGAVSVAEGGKLTRYLDEKNLEQLLDELLLPKTHGSGLWQWRS